MTLPWPQVLFIAITFVTLPLYILILIVVCKQPELSTFYVLMVSEGVADIYAVVSYFLATALRFTLWLDELYWGHERFFANYAYLSVYFSTYVRSVGITLIAFQRYVIICLRGKPLGKILGGIPSFAYVAVHWTTALILTAPVCTSLNNHFDTLHKLNILNPPKLFAFGCLMATFIVGTCFIISMICYALILVHVFNNRKRSVVNSSEGYELRLCVQAAMLLLALLMFLTYHVGQYIIGDAIHDIPLLLYYWRPYFSPITTAFASWVEPWSCLAFNREIRRNIMKLVCCRKKRLGLTVANKISVLQAGIAYKLRRTRCRRTRAGAVADNEVHDGT
ncbi:hypothetical protein V3C99_007099 [Haemonchus contortus]